MGVPYFQVKKLAETHGIVAFSSNYALYADMSSRVMTTLEQLAPSVEVYSIDEAFLDLTGVKACTDLTKFGKQVKSTVFNWTGIHVCVGIAPSKTLAKLANHAAKKWTKTDGLVDLCKTSPQFTTTITSCLPPVALSCNHQLPQSSSLLGLSYERTADINSRHIFSQCILLHAFALQQFALMSFL